MIEAARHRANICTRFRQQVPNHPPASPAVLEVPGGCIDPPIHPNMEDINLSKTTADRSDMPSRRSHAAKNTLVLWPGTATRGVPTRHKNKALWIGVKHM